ncbi:MAG: SIR2 family NAD-dependent protein deacylase [Acidimicrobiia bacterium]
MELAGWLAEARRVVVLTGAGISTESGIPDFRGPDGVWTKDPSAEKLSSLPHYLASREIRVASWKSRLAHPAWTATPNPGHLALVEIERRGHLHLLVTQNIDGLHTLAGSSPEITVEIHGTVHEVVCMSCGDRSPMPAALARVRAGEEDPACRRCGGILKSATISFGQSLVASDLERASRSAASCDLFLAIGTSLTVHPVASFPELAVRTGARLAILNAQPTPYDVAAHCVCRLPIGSALTFLANALRVD